MCVCECVEIGKQSWDEGKIDEATYRDGEKRERENFNSEFQTSLFLQSSCICVWSFVLFCIWPHPQHMEGLGQ